jgi:hypothetical protein
MMVVGSAVHTFWVAKGIGMKFRSEPHNNCSPILELATKYWDQLYVMSAAPGYVGTAVLAYLVVFAKTTYPRWAILFNPAVFLLLLSLGAGRISLPFGAILVGGTMNLSIATFFAISLFLTRREDRSGTSQV